MFVLTTSMPTPRPDTSVTCRAVEKPGRRIREIQFSRRHPVEFRFGLQPHRQRLGPHGLGIDAPAVIADLDADLAILVRRREGDLPVGGLPFATRSAGVSMPWSTLLRTRWVSGSESCSRIVLSSSTSRPMTVISTCFPSCLAEVTDHPREFPEQVADRLHPGPQHRLLERRGDRVEPLHDRPDLAVVLIERQQGLIPDQRQLAGQRHQPVEQFDADPQRGRLVASGAAARASAGPALAAGTIRPGAGGSAVRAGLAIARSAVGSPIQDG